tara:strand:+ start:4753 stop:5823 length:1071 start_codon:yes stop_codon:yes gene_type:complete
MNYNPIKQQGFMIKILNCISQNQIPLIHGPTGSGKTTLVKQIFGNKTWHLYCPLEPKDFEYMTDSINNNPRQTIIIDNLEAADSSTIKSINDYISKKKKKCTKLILITIDPYSLSLRTLRTKTCLCPTPIISKAKMIQKAENHGASQETISKIATENIKDYRVLKRMILDGNTLSYDKTTNLALRNPFKAFSWLLGEKSNADKNQIIDADPFFYSMGIFTNYPNASSNINDIEKMVSNLSDADYIGYESLNFHNAVISRTSVYTPCSKNIKVNFPKFTITHNQLNNTCKSQEHKETMSNLVRYFNKTPKSKLLNHYIETFKKYYGLTIQIAEKLLKILGDTKSPKLRVHMKGRLEK